MTTRYQTIIEVGVTKAFERVRVECAHHEHWPDARRIVLMVGSVIHVECNYVRADDADMTANALGDVGRRYIA